MASKLRNIKDVLVLCGPSGCGKSTLISRLDKEFPGRFGFCVSHTTRPPRQGEVADVHYHFTDHSTMNEMKARKEFLETAHVHGNIYGTSFAAVEVVKSRGKICILDIDVQGVNSLKEDGRLNALYVFLKPPSIEALEKRLISRGSESPTRITLRMNNARVELKAIEEPEKWDVILTNDNLEDCYAEFKTFLKDEEMV
jgi:guanylate kinase